MQTAACACGPTVVISSSLFLSSFAALLRTHTGGFSFPLSWSPVGLPMPTRGARVGLGRRARAARTNKGAYKKTPKQNRLAQCDKKTRAHIHNKGPFFMEKKSASRMTPFDRRRERRV